MLSNEILKELRKLRFHIEKLNEALENDEERQLTSLIIRLNWDQDDLKSVHSIFEDFHKKLEKGETPEWSEFKETFETKLGVDHQALKDVIRAFYKRGDWKDVCKKYAEDNNCTEFDGKLYE
ncbi:hypothetical protein ISS30_03810 [bacterium]|nr:hypothetical protein [bacterium]